MSHHLLEFAEGIFDEVHAEDALLTLELRCEVVLLGNLQNMFCFEERASTDEIIAAIRPEAFKFQLPSLFDLSDTMKLKDD